MASNSRTAPYAVISPVKNEERYIARTIESMISQKRRPAVWIIVDDASSDGTALIVKQFVGANPWIRYLLYPGEAVRKTGSAEIHAFNYGYKSLRETAFDFIVKLDGDLRFDDAYFETLLAQFGKNGKLGIASGTYLEEKAGSWRPVVMPEYHAAGASKVVRRECFGQIGGFIAERGWDTVDEIRAQAHGWETRHFKDIWFFHLRREGTGMGLLRTNVMHGEIFYRTGGSLIFLIVKALRRMVMGTPLIAAGAAMIYGYMAALFRRQKPLVNEQEARAYRRLLYSRLSGGFQWLFPGQF